MILRITFILIFALINVAAADMETSMTNSDDPPVGPLWLNSNVNVDFESTPLIAALSLLSRQGNFNIVAPPLEDYFVTAHLKNASMRKALNAILRVSGHDYYIDGDILVVKEASDDMLGELHTRVFRLDYIDARQIETQVRNMLSSKGKLQIVSAGVASREEGISNYPSKIMAVTDLEYVLPAVEDFISRVDAMPKQVSIEVKLIETDLSEKERFGFDWQKNLNLKITGADPGFDNQDNTSAEDLMAFANHPYSKSDFVYGTLTVSEASLLIDFLKESGNSKLLSNPSVTTVDGKPARIEVATTIPIQTINRFSEGAAVQDIATYQYKDVGITLDVTPVVNSDGYITLKCKPSVEEITGWVGPEDSQQPITAKRTVTTDVLVKDGETLVIGGLIKESTINSTSGVWLLSDIPVIGELFKSRSRTKSTTDLMILIKPTILR